MYIHIYLFIYLFILMYKYICIYTARRIGLSTFTAAWDGMRRCVYVYVCIYICICIYVYIYMYVYMNVYAGNVLSEVDRRFGGGYIYI